MKVVGVGYRRWAYDIFNSLGIETVITTANDKLREFDIFEDDVKEFPDVYKVKHLVKLVDEKNNLVEFVKEADILLFYGWSWMVPMEVIDNKICICLHPSKLPEYRGGSPIQNQIIDGVVDSAVTLFRMDNDLDHGNIIGQSLLDLSGSIDSIFDDMVHYGILLTKEMLRTNDFVGVPQDHSKATFCKRRKPKDSEITLEEIKTSTSKQLSDKIRALQYPYPLPYIVCGDGKRLFFYMAEAEK